MQLRNARLCLDCEEIHDAPQCPSCASETFAFITRWVPAPERRGQPRPVEPQSPENLDTYRQMLANQQQKRTARWRAVQGGAVGLALFGLAGWMWRRSQQSSTESASSDGSRAIGERSGRG